MKAYKLLHEVEAALDYYESKWWSNVELLAEVNKSVRGHGATMPQLCALIALMQETGEIVSGETGWHRA
jgi:hypothetical protein